MESHVFRGRGRGRGAVLNDNIVEDLRRPNTINPAAHLVMDGGDHSQAEVKVLLDRLHQVEQQTPNWRDCPQANNANAEEIRSLIERLNQVDVRGMDNWRAGASQNKAQECKTYTLSAEAKEFVPRSFAPPEQPQAAPPYVTQIVPGQFQQNNQMFAEPQLELFNHPTVVEVNNLVVELSLSPDRYHSISRKISTLLNANTSSDVMKEVVTVIFEQGQGEPNFRYNGAKLCADVSRNVDRIFKTKTFKTMLIDRLNEEFQIKDYLLYHEPERYRGYLMFFAEIFTQVTSSENLPFDIFAQSICDLLKLLTANPYPTDENISCVTKVLKFTGSSLENGSPKLMEGVFSDVRQLLLHPNLKESTKKQLMSVIELRAGNWGKGPPSPKSESDSEKPKSGNVPVFETVYYGPNGVIQKVDEKCDDSASDIDDGVISAELDGEAAAAFEEFLKLQQNE